MHRLNDDAGIRKRSRYARRPVQSVEDESGSSSSSREPLPEKTTAIAVVPTPTETAASLMAMSRQDLDEALRQADDLSESERRALLAEAFALPANDYRRARMIRSLLGQLAETAPLEALAMPATNSGQQRMQAMRWKPSSMATNRKRRTTQYQVAG